MEFFFILTLSEPCVSESTDFSSECVVHVKVVSGLHNFSVKLIDGRYKDDFD